MTKYKPTSNLYYIGTTKWNTFDIFSSYPNLEEAKKNAHFLSKKQKRRYVIVKKIGEVE